MSLFTGNIVDENGVAVDCEFRFLHYNTGALSGVRSTELQQWSVDSDDSDVNNQAAAFAVGDIAIIYYYTTDKCAVVKIIGDGSDSYVFDVQLKECQAPTTTILVDDNVIGNVVASHSSSDQYQWDYKGTTHYHKYDWYGQVWCADVGIANVEYDWGAGYVVDDSHEFTTSGEYLVKLRVTNNCGLTAEDAKTIKIQKTIPSVQLSNSVLTPKKNEETTVTIVNTDVDSAIVNQTWFVDGIETTELVHSFEDVVSHEFKITTVWNDGFMDAEFDTVLMIEMENVGPSVNLTYIENEGNLYDASTAITIGDAPVSTIRYKVYYKLPLSGEIVECVNKLDDEQIEFTLLNSGEYTVTVTVTDELGGVGTDTVVITVVCGESSSESSDVATTGVRYIEWE